MELRAEKIAPGDAGAEARPVAAARNRGLAQWQRIAVHEVGIVRAGDAREQRAGALGLQSVPAHVRDRPAGRLGESAGGPRDDTETAGFVLRRRLVQQLHAEAYSEHRLAERRDEGVETARAKSRHRIARSADAREQHVAGRADARSIGGYLGRGAESIERELQRGDVRPAGGDDDDAHEAPAPLIASLWCWAARCPRAGSPAAGSGRPP